MCKSTASSMWAWPPTFAPAIVASISTHMDVSVPAGSLSIAARSLRSPVVDHALIQLAVAFAHCKKRRKLLLIEVVLHGSRFTVDAFSLGMRRQAPERFHTVGRDPSRQRKNPASQGPIRMHPAPPFAEKAAIAIFLRPQDRADPLLQAE